MWLHGQVELECYELSVWLLFNSSARRSLVCIYTKRKTANYSRISQCCLLALWCLINVFFTSGFWRDTGSVGV